MIPIPRRVEPQGSDGWMSLSEEFRMSCCSRGYCLFRVFKVGKECLVAFSGLDFLSESRSLPVTSSVSS